MPYSEIQNLVLSKLGRIPAERFEHLAKIHLEHSVGPTPDSLDCFQRFLETIGELERANPSLFLTDEGNFEIVWEDAAGKSVQFELQAGTIEFYREATDYELVVSINNLEKLLLENELPLAS